MKDRFENSKVNPGTQIFHRFVPLNKEEIMVYPISIGTGEKKQMRKKGDGTEIDDVAMLDNLKDIRPGQYVGCIYEMQVWLGVVEEYSGEFDDFTVNFLHPSVSSGSSSYSFPPKKDSCAVPGHHIVALFSPPSLRGSIRVQYIFQQNELAICVQHAQIVLK